MKSIKLNKTLICLFLVFSMILGAASVSFATLNDKKNELGDINGQIDDLEKDLKDGKNKSTALGNEIKALEKQIYSAEVEINNLQKEINAYKEKITVALAELEEMEKEINQQNSQLDARLRAMYKNGDVGMLAVLLGSKDMSSFLTNMEMVKRIYAGDEALLKEMQGEYDVLEDKRKELVAYKDQLVSKQEEYEAKSSALASDKSTLSSKKKAVDSDNKELESQIDALNKEADALVAEILKLQGNQSYIGGNMLWPSNNSKYVSSPFGMRLHPILKVYKMHTGIDIAAAYGTNILASNGGKVISACYNSGYGYMVMIDHGGGIVTLYAHASKLLVKQGDIVTRGQTIALVGSTGNSTGPHIHFEVRKNGAYENPLNYVSR